MPIAQFQDPANKVNIVRSFRTPKNITQQEAWIKEARKSIPSIPKLHKELNWRIEFFDATLETITITLRNCFGERCYVAINRKSSL